MAVSMAYEEARLVRVDCFTPRSALDSRQRPQSRDFAASPSHDELAAAKPATFHLRQLQPPAAAARISRNYLRISLTCVFETMRLPGRPLRTMLHCSSDRRGGLHKHRPTTFPG